MNDSGFIILLRKILEWRWYSDINTCRLFIHMLLRANWKDGKFRDITVPRGSFVSSVAKLAQETGLTDDEVRTAISHLISTNEITKRSTNKYTVFTVVNYVVYQDVPEQEHSQVTVSPQTIAKLFPTIEQKETNITREQITNSFCSEPEKSAPNPSGSGILLPLNDKSFYDVPLDKIALWKETYPAVDVQQELRHMAAWLDCNPQRRKTLRGINRFVNSWLAREQDRGGSKGKRGGDRSGADDQSRRSAADFYKQFMGTGDGDEC